jgi:hypothetical protein
MSKWLELAERCEKATDEDRDIDRCIAAYLPDGFQTYPISGFTSSLDAITALIDRELPGWACNSGRTPDEFKLVGEPNFTASLIGDIREVQFGYDEPPELDYSNHEGKAATEPLARCAAFCRAMNEKEENA